MSIFETIDSLLFERILFIVHILLKYPFTFRKHILCHLVLEFIELLGAQSTTFSQWEKYLVHELNKLI